MALRQLSSRQAEPNRLAHLGGAVRSVRPFLSARRSDPGKDSRCYRAYRLEAA